MGKKLYVGQLSYETTDGDLHSLFTPHGTVVSARVIMDRETNRSKGFGFVEMGSDAEAQAGIAALNGQAVNGRALAVSEARPREDRPREPSRIGAAAADVALEPVQPRAPFPALFSGRVLVLRARTRPSHSADLPSSNRDSTG